MIERLGHLYFTNHILPERRKDSPNRDANAPLGVLLDQNSEATLSADPQEVIFRQTN